MIQIRNRFTNDVILEVNDLRGANLRGANLSDADLNGADLSGADLRGANLSDADLSDANLRGADLSFTDLSDADLRDANLSGADLDFSCLHFSCKSRMAKTDRRQRVQLAHHLLSWMKYADNLSEDEKQIFDQLKAYANEFHRKDVEKF